MIIARISAFPVGIAMGFSGRAPICRASLGFFRRLSRFYQLAVGLAKR